MVSLNAIILGLVAVLVGYVMLVQIKGTFKGFTGEKRPSINPFDWMTDSEGSPSILSFIFGWNFVFVWRLIRLAIWFLLKEIKKK